MQINRTSINNKLSQCSTPNFKGCVIENRCYKNIKKIAKKSDSSRRILENVEATLKRFPKGYDLELNYYDDKIPDTVQLGRLKQGAFNWIDVVRVTLKSKNASCSRIVPKDSGSVVAIINFLNELTNPFGKMSDVLFKGVKTDRKFLKELTYPFGEFSSVVFHGENEGQNIYDEILQMDSELFDKYKQWVVDKKTGQVNYQAFDRSIIYYLEEMVENKKQPPVEVYKFLTKMAEDPVLSKEMAKQFSYDPRGGATIKNTLIKYLGGGQEGEDMFFTWYYDETSGYRAAYDRYFNEEIWNKAENLADLVKQSPNLYTAAFRKFVREKGVEPVLGELPLEFGNRESFSKLIKELKILNKNLQKEYKAKKTAQGDSLMIPLEIDGKTYNVQKLGKGLSAKLKYRIVSAESPENSYILKFAPYDALGDTDRSRKFRDNQALRPDMPYTDALVDFYLKENNCLNAADIKFFDYDAQAVLYKETLGEEPEFQSDLRLNLYRFKKFGPIADVYKLGVHLNDIWKSNFLVDENGIYKCIDSGHAKFDNIFRPLVAGKHFALANVCGRE